MGEYTDSCGTPACALGHYASRGDLQKAFKLGDPSGTSSYQFVVLRKWGGFVDYYAGAVLDHFGIEYPEAGELFGGNGCGGAKTVKQAAKYIENFVKRKGFDVEEA